MHIQEALIEGYNILKKNNIDTYMLDAQLLLSKAINKDKMFIIMNRDAKITEIEEKTFFEYINLRSEKMPIKYITGQCEFMSLDFCIKPGVLIPRPDTELLVQWGIDKLKFKIDNNINTIKVCDLCCGSGIIGLSVAKYILDYIETKNQSKILKTEFNVELYDISEIAIELTNNNIKSLGLESICKARNSDLLDSAINNNSKFDILLSNPPYISIEDMETLMDDVKNYEPELALCGGTYGLDFYRKIIYESKRVLKVTGYIGFEIGYDQGNAVSTLLKENNFKDVEIMKDLNGLDRVVVGHL